MSGLPTVIGDVATRILSLAFDTPAPRMIDAPSSSRPVGTALGIVAHVTISEDAEDELEITQHPVEQGAQISDHAFKRPSVLRVQLGWTDSGSWRPSPLGGGVPVFTPLVTDVRGIYHRILDLQDERFPFTVITGKRLYENMLVQSIRSSTDERSETSFFADITFRQVILVSTQLVAGAAKYSAVANSNPALLGNPRQNQPSTSTGPVQTQPTSYKNPSDIPGVPL